MSSWTFQQRFLNCSFAQESKNFAYFFLNFVILFCTDKTRELEMRVKVAEDSAENSQKELKDYKDKAARILQVATPILYWEE